ncbi:MAG: hypothetical protein NTY65_16760 [Planctomycetota bacterium]|nr:hypothetical protein [Planctomycetota bacterium]
MTTDERIENLEKGLASARRLNRWLLAAVGLALGVWILAGTFGPTMAAAPAGGGAVKEVRANRFVVEDENGKVRASLGMGKETVPFKTDTGLVTPAGNGPVLELYAEDGKARARLAVMHLLAGRIGGAGHMEEPRLSLFGDNGMPRVEMVVSFDVPRLYLHDENFQTRASLIVNEGRPFLNLFDENNKLIWRAP